jgi:energy-coupling factor transporter ATP-binding protein EcfA2
MKPIDFIGIKNFRVFNDQEGIFEELSSINLLTGTNNSGKSSIIKYLQLLKNSVAGNKIPFDLDLDEQEHLLGDFENVLNNTVNRNIEISLPFTFLGITTIYSTLSFEIPSKNDSYKAHLRKMTITDKKDDTDLFTFSFIEATDEEKKSNSEEHKLKLQEYQDKKNTAAQQSPENLFLNQFYMSPPYSPLVAYIDWSINVEKLRYYLIELLEFYEVYLKHKGDENFLQFADKELEKQSFIASFFMKSLNSDTLVESWKDFLQSDFKTGTKLSGRQPLLEYDFQSEEYFWPEPQIEEILYYQSIDILNKNLNWKNISDPDNEYFVISECFKKSYKELIGRISTINYLSTVKEENSRIYIGTNNSTFTKLLKNYSSLDIDTNFINKYLKAFEIGDEIIVNFVRKLQVIKISIKSVQFPIRDLVDFGYGIKQLVLVLMHIAVIAEKNKRSKEVITDEGENAMEDYYVPSLLLIEEPETNLHPKWQSLLAEMFVEANELYNIQLVIETHSEYLIRKFQTLTAQGKINSKEIKIFYLRGAHKVTKDRKQVETIFIESDGTIDYKLFDDGFFDEADRLELSLLNFQRDNFFKDFAALKSDNEDNENKIVNLQLKIDDFTNKADIRVYETLVNRIFVDPLKLLPDSLRYLSTGHYLLDNINDHSDFSPVILQYGRSVENELKGLFINIHPTKRWTIGEMQKALESFRSFIISGTSTPQNTTLQQVLTTFFNTPVSLKIELIDDLRIKRNEAAHPGPIRTKAEAEDYINKINDFLKKWIELKK